jgi:hypothetical protein
LRSLAFIISFRDDLNVEKFDFEMQFIIYIHTHHLCFISKEMAALSQISVMSTFCQNEFPWKILLISLSLLISPLPSDRSLNQKSFLFFHGCRLLRLPWNKGKCFYFFLDTGHLLILVFRIKSVWKIFINI